MTTQLEALKSEERDALITVCIAEAKLFDARAAVARRELIEFLADPFSDDARHVINLRETIKRCKAAAEDKRFQAVTLI